MTTDVDLDPARIEQASAHIDPVLLNSPQFVDSQLNSALGRHVLVKLETANPLHSFKGRGAWALAREVEAGSTLVCASAGNFGQGLAYAGRAMGLPVEIFVDQRASQVAVQRMRALGAQVRSVNDDAARAAREHAAERSERLLVQDGKHPRIAEGAGTIGRELLHRDTFDTIVLPVGDGALITGIARWLKEHTPQVRVVGVCAAGSAAMAEAWRTGEIATDAAAETIASTLANSAPIPESVRRMRALVDDVILVDDEALRDGMRLAVETLGVVLEPAGAAGIAAIATSTWQRLPGERLATVLTGSNPPGELVREVLAAPDLLA